MSTYVQKEGTGASFPNKKKTSESSPVLLGTLTIPADMAGKKVNIASWLNSNNDNKYYSHKLSEIKIADKPKNTDIDLDSENAPF